MSTTNGVPAAEAAGAAPGPPPATRPRAPTALMVLAVLAIGYTLWAAQALILLGAYALFALALSPLAAAAAIRNAQG